MIKKILILIALGIIVPACAMESLNKLNGKIALYQVTEKDREEFQKIIDSDLLDFEELLSDQENWNKKFYKFVEIVIDYYHEGYNACGDLRSQSFIEIHLFKNMSELYEKLTEEKEVANVMTAIERMKAHVSAKLMFSDSRKRLDEYLERALDKYLAEVGSVVKENEETKRPDLKQEILDDTKPEQSYSFSIMNWIRRHKIAVTGTILGAVGLFSIFIFMKK